MDSGPSAPPAAREPTAESSAAGAKPSDPPSASSTKNHIGPPNFNDVGEAVVELEGVCKFYREGGQDHLVLDQVDAAFSNSQTTALIGRSGCGKSTLLNLVAGIDTPSQGIVRVAGVDLGALDERQRTLFRRRHIGFVFQFFNLLPTLSVEDNVLLPLELAGGVGPKGRRRAIALLEAVSLADRLRAFPDRLSGGERQRVALARALVHDPPLILADEPTGNLDRETGEEVLTLLDRLVRSEGRTLLLVTHSAGVAASADHVFTVRNKGLEETTRDDLQRIVAGP